MQTRQRILRGDESDAAAAASLFVTVPGSNAMASHGGLPDVVEAARRSGYDDGYQTALSEFAAADASAKAAQLRRVTDALVAAAHAMVDIRATAVQVAASEAIALGIELAEALVCHELAINPSSLDAVQRALSLVPTGEDLIVRIHPDDPVDPAEIQALVVDANVKVVSDPSVEIGGCVVDAGPCRIDAQVGPALRRARELISELYRRPDAGEGEGER